MLYEAFIPVVDAQSRPFSPGVFRKAHRELADQFGFVFNWPVYRPVHATRDEIVEQEYVRFQANVPDALDNHLSIFAWKDVQEQRLGCEIWMIYYRAP